MTNRVKNTDFTHTFIGEIKNWVEATKWERIYKKQVKKEWTKIKKVCVYKNREKQRMLGHEEWNCPLMILKDEGELPQINSWFTLQCLK
jgi:hypothetical protein